MSSVEYGMSCTTLRTVRLSSKESLVVGNGLAAPGPDRPEHEQVRLVARSILGVLYNRQHQLSRQGKEQELCGIPFLVPLYIDYWIDGVTLILFACSVLGPLLSRSIQHQDSLIMYGGSWMVSRLHL